MNLTTSGLSSSSVFRDAPPSWNSASIILPNRLSTIDVFGISPEPIR